MGLIAEFSLRKDTNADSSDVTYIKAIYSKPVTYDPAQMNDGASLIFSELVYEGLLRFTESYGLRAGIAESWKTSDDGKEITFILNKKAHFHNGDKVSAQDVVVSLSRVLAPSSLVYKYYDMIKGADEYHLSRSKAVEGIKALDPHTVVIQLKSAFPPILYVLAGGTAKILPAKLVNQKGFFSHPIGAGPFKVKQIGESDIELTRSKLYHGELPKLKNLTLRAIDQTLAMQEAESGKIHDLSSWPLSGMEEIFKHGQDISTVVADTWIIGFNTRIPPMDKLEVRQAFKASIDQEKFRKRFYPSAAKAYGYVPDGFPGHKNQPEKIIFKKVPSHSPIVIAIPKELDKAQEIAQFFRDELQSKGWNVKTRLMAWSELMKRYEEKTLQSFLVSMIVDYPDTEFLLNNFASANPDNFSGIKDPLIDDLLKKARGLQDRVKRYKIYQALADRVNGLALSANLFHSRPHYWLHNCVKNFKPNLLAVAYIDYRKVSLDSNCLGGQSE